MDHATLQFLNLMEHCLLYLSVFGLSDLFISKMKFNTRKKFLYYTFLGVLGLIVFALTIYF
jgi:hypothetical protein